MLFACKKYEDDGGPGGDIKGIIQGKWWPGLQDQAAAMFFGALSGE